MTKEPWATPELRKAQEELRRLTGDEEMRQRYEARLRQVQIWATELEDSYLQGHEEGREEALREVARRQLATGEAPERVAELTGLQLDTVRSLP